VRPSYALRSATIRVYSSCKCEPDREKPIGSRLCAARSVSLFFL
jgi:hypothetical protein